MLRPGCSEFVRGRGKRRLGSRYVQDDRRGTLEALDALGRIAGNWMSWVSMSNKKLIDRCIRLVAELGEIGYEESAERVFAAQEWVAAQDWSKGEEPSPVQVALGQSA